MKKFKTIISTFTMIYITFNLMTFLIALPIVDWEVRETLTPLLYCNYILTSFYLIVVLMTLTNSLIGKEVK